MFFLTKGRFKSTHGAVTKFSHNFSRVFAVDSSGNEVPRAPKNVRITNIGANNIQVSNPRSYEGSNSDIGAVIGLKHEQFYKKFCSKFSWINYPHFPSQI